MNIRMMQKLMTNIPTKCGSHYIDQNSYNYEQNQPWPMKPSLEETGW